MFSENNYTLSINSDDIWSNSIQNGRSNLAIYYVTFKYKSPPSQLFVPQLVQVNDKTPKLRITGPFVKEIYRSPVDSFNTEPVMRKAFPWHGVIMLWSNQALSSGTRASATTGGGQHISVVLIYYGHCQLWSMASGILDWVVIKQTSYVI